MNRTLVTKSPSRADIPHPPVGTKGYIYHTVTRSIPRGKVSIMSTIIHHPSAVQPTAKRPPSKILSQGMQKPNGPKAWLQKDAPLDTDMTKGKFLDLLQKGSGRLSSIALSMFLAKAKCTDDERRDMLNLLSPEGPDKSLIPKPLADFARNLVDGLSYQEASQARAEQPPAPTSLRPNGSEEAPPSFQANRNVGPMREDN